MDEIKGLIFDIKNSPFTTARVFAQPFSSKAVR